MEKQGVTDAQLIWKSDRTGYFTVWNGVEASGNIVAAVGFGPTEAKAKVDGLAAIRKAGAKSQFFIAHRYTSHGSDFVFGSPLLPDLDDSAIESEDIGYFSPDGRFALSISHSRGFKLRRIDLVDLQTFERVIEFAMPMALAGSIVWSADSQSLAFFGEERAYADTWAYKLQDGKWLRMRLPNRDTFPDPDLSLKSGEEILETKNDVVRPKAWTSSSDLELEHVVDVIAEKNSERVAAVTAILSLTINFHTDDTANITAASPTVRRPARKSKKRATSPTDLPARVQHRPAGRSVRDFSRRPCGTPTSAPDHRSSTSSRPGRRCGFPCEFRKPGGRKWGVPHWSTNSPLPLSDMPSGGPSFAPFGLPPMIAFIISAFVPTGFSPINVR